MRLFTEKAYVVCYVNVSSYTIRTRDRHFTLTRDSSLADRFDAHHKAQLELYDWLEWLNSHPNYCYEHGCRPHGGLFVIQEWIVGFDKC